MIFNLTRYRIFVIECKYNHNKFQHAREYSLYNSGGLSLQHVKNPDPTASECGSGSKKLAELQAVLYLYVIRPIDIKVWKY